MFERKINLFEKILLPVGFIIIVFGFYMLVQADIAGKDIYWLRVMTIFLWMILILLLIVSAVIQDMKEELAIITKEHVHEVKMMKDLFHDHLEETKLLIKELKKSK